MLAQKMKVVRLKRVDDPKDYKLRIVNNKFLIKDRRIRVLFFDNSGRCQVEEEFVFDDPSYAIKLTNEELEVELKEYFTLYPEHKGMHVVILFQGNDEFGVPLYISGRKRRE